MPYTQEFVTTCFDLMPALFEPYAVMTYDGEFIQVHRPHLNI